MAITFWRNVQRKITTQEMDASFDTLVEDIANAGLSAEMPDGQIYIGDNTNTATLETLDKALIGLSNVDNTSDANKPISIAGMAAHSTGIKTGGVVSIGTGGAGVATTFTIASGVGMVVDNTVTPATLVNVTWSAKTDVAVTNIGTQPLTFVAIDSSGNVVQQATDFSGALHRQYIVIGTIIHTNLTTVTAVNQGQHLAISPQAQLNDLFQSLAGFNITGNIFSANGTNLNLNKTAGEIFKQGANYSTSANNPNIVITGSLTVATFRYNNQTGNASGILSAIDPNNYDLAGVTTAVSVNKFTIQRIYLFSSNLLAIQRGQIEYNSLAEAKASIQTESFIVNPSIVPNGVLRAYLIVQQGATALNSATKAFFLEAPKFGGTAGVGGLSVSTLQNAYDNSISPEILTDTTRGAVSVKRGSTADTDTVIEVLNGAGTVTASVDGNGLIYSGQATASTPTFFDSAKKLITTTAQLWGTWVQTWSDKATPVDADTIGFHDSASTFVGVKSTLLNFWTAYLLPKIQALGYLTGGGTTNTFPMYASSSILGDSFFKYRGAGLGYNLEESGTTSYFHIRSETSTNSIRFFRGATEDSLISVTSALMTIRHATQINVSTVDGASVQVKLTESRHSANQISFFSGGARTGFFSSSYLYMDKQIYVAGGGIKVVAGGIYSGAGTINTSAILQADSTTQGFLPPRMTNAQRTSIASPAIGLMVYCTDATEGLYIYKSTGWTFII
jgi:hypothetical protein